MARDWSALQGAGPWGSGSCVGTCPGAGGDGPRTGRRSLGACPCTTRPNTGVPRRTEKQKTEWLDTGETADYIETVDKQLNCVHSNKTDGLIRELANAIAFLYLWGLKIK